MSQALIDFFNTPVTFAHVLGWGIGSLIIIVVRSGKEDR